jgi:hypothetical protein
LQTSGSANFLFPLSYEIQKFNWTYPVFSYIPFSSEVMYVYILPLRILRITYLEFSWSFYIVQAVVTASSMLTVPSILNPYIR